VGLARGGFRWTGELCFLGGQVIEMVRGVSGTSEEFGGQLRDGYTGGTGNWPLDERHVGLNTLFHFKKRQKCMSWR